MTATLTRPGPDAPPPVSSPPRRRRGWLPTRASVQDFRRAWSPREAAGGQSLVPLAVLSALAAVDDLDSRAFNRLLPEIRADFGLDLQSALTVQAVSAPLLILAGLGAGWLADRARRTRMIAGGAFVWGGFTLLTGLAPTVAMLAVARAGAGLGKVVNAPAQQGLLADSYPVGNRARIFSLHSLAGNLDDWLAPLAAGILAEAFGWRAAFFVFPVLTLMAALAATRLRDPERGGQELAHLGLVGASHHAAGSGSPAGAVGPAPLVAEPPPSLAESWRIATGVGTLRRIWLALPLLVGAGAGISALLSLFLEEEFGLGPQARGLVFLASGAAGIVGLLVGAHLAERHLLDRPGRALELVGILSGLTALSFALIAVVPNLAVFVAVDVVRAFASAILAPGLFATMSLVIPPRARSFALAAGAVFVLPGLLLLPAVGAVGDAYGIRASILVLVPMYLVGALIVASAGALVGPDLRSAFAAAAARTRANQARASGGLPLVMVSELTAGHGPTGVLFGVHLEVHDGEVLALCGPNGCGKSTLLRCLAGLHLPASGTVLIDGLDTTFVPADELAGRGVAYAPAGHGVVPELTVAEHLELAAWHRATDPALVTDRAALLAEVPEVAERLHQAAGTLSSGEQQLLTLTQVALARPRLALLDEATFALAPAAVPRAVALVRHLAEGGATVIFVDHQPEVVDALATRVVSMTRGIVMEGRQPGALRVAQVAARRTPRSARAGAPVLAGYGLRAGHAPAATLLDVSVEVNPAEILVVVGANGSGKTTLLDVLGGSLAARSGSVVLGGRDVTALGAPRRAALGLRRLHADARLFASLTVREAVGLASGDRSVRRALERVGVDDLADLRCGELSTGQRRLVNLAVGLAGRPTVVLLDEPTAGVATAETGRIAALVRRARDELECALVVVEHDLVVAGAIADRAVHLDAGAVVADGDPTTVLTTFATATAPHP